MNIALPFDITRPTAVAVSGGVDSMVLLHWVKKQADAAGVRLFSFHVHHGLQPQADDWLALVQDFCAKNTISFDHRHLDASTRQNAQSIEEWARRGRYRALTEMAQAHEISQVLLAHHQDDQVETYCLQRQRGAGARGLSAMPMAVERDGIDWLRPLLSLRKTEIEQYARMHAVPHAHDPSNADTRYARNALRAQWAQQPLSPTERQTILTEIEVAQTAYRAQSHWAQAQLAQLRVPHRAEIGECGRLRAFDWSKFIIEQHQWLLREWLTQLGWRMPSRAALAELVKQLSNPSTDQQMCWRHPDGGAVAKFQQDWVAAQLLPAGQWWLTDEVRQRMVQEHLTIRPRRGGERLRLAPNRPHISLKHAYQMSGVAPMLRPQLPLLYAGERLVYVVGVGTVWQ